MKIEKKHIIYAELNKRQILGLKNGIYEIEIPFGVKLHNKLIGKRGLLFTCKNKKCTEELINGLKNSEINFHVKNA